MRCDGEQQPVITMARAIDADGRAGGGEGEVFDPGPGGAFGWRCGGVSLLELSAEVRIGADYARGRESPVEERDVGGEEGSRDRSGVGDLGAGGVRFVVLDVAPSSVLSRSEGRVRAGCGVPVAPVLLGGVGGPTCGVRTVVVAGCAASGEPEGKREHDHRSAIAEP